MIDHVGKALRPSGAVGAVGQMGRQVIENVYPQPLAVAPATLLAAADFLDGEPADEIRSSKDGVILAFDVRGSSPLRKATTA